MREIEKDGFITREADLKTDKITDKIFEEQSDWSKILPPPYGEIYINPYGTVLMCKGTYNKIMEKE
jgi:hypothetical protein